jgi:hypothetical protein
MVALLMAQLLVLLQLLQVLLLQPQPLLHLEALYLKLQILLAVHYKILVEQINSNGVVAVVII